MKTELLVAIISASGAIISALIAGGAILFAAKRVISRKKLRVDYAQALADLQFLLEVEKAHTEISVGLHERSNKVAIRDAIRTEKGIDISGKNTLTSIRRKLAVLSTHDD